jgi:hypothetical protein
VTYFPIVGRQIVLRSTAPSMVASWRISRARTMPGQKVHNLWNIMRQRTHHCTRHCHLLRKHNSSIVRKDDSNFT